MTRTKFLLTVGAFGVLALASCAKPGQPAAPPAEVAEPKRIASVDVVKAEVQPVEIPLGGSGEMTMRLAIQSGFHVNANPPTFPYLIPVELIVTPSEGMSVSAVSYPPGHNVKLEFSETPLAVYEGNIEIKATVKADKTAKPGQHSLAAKLRIQACDDQVCYPPGTRELAIPLVIK